MPKKIDSALRERAVRLVREHRAEYPSNAKAIAAVARQEGVGAEVRTFRSDATSRDFACFRASWSPRSRPLASVAME